MFGGRRCWLLLSASFCGVPACSHLHTATDLQDALMDDVRWESRWHLTDMVDNAILQDMSVSDIHFVPHTSEISGTGATRLDRMARLLDTYGGTVRYETYLTDEQMIQKRLEHVGEYLALAGCNMSRVELNAMQSGGRGMPAIEAIKAYERGTSPDSASGGTQPIGLPMGSGQSGSQ